MSGQEPHFRVHGGHQPMVVPADDGHELTTDEIAQIVAATINAAKPASQTWAVVTLILGLLAAIVALAWIFAR